MFMIRRISHKPSQEELKSVDQSLQMYQTFTHQIEEQNMSKQNNRIFQKSIKKQQSQIKQKKDPLKDLKLNTESLQFPKSKDACTMTDKLYKIENQHFPKLIHNKTCNFFHRNIIPHTQISRHLPSIAPKDKASKLIKDPKCSKSNPKFYKKIKYRTIDDDSIPKKLEFFAMNHLGTSFKGKYGKLIDSLNKQYHRITLIVGQRQYKPTFCNIFALFLQFRSNELQNLKLQGKINNRINKPFLLAYASLQQNSPIIIRSLNHLVNIQQNLQQILQKYKNQLIIELFKSKEFGSKLKLELQELKDTINDRFQFYENLYEIYEKSPFQEQMEQESESKTESMKLITSNCISVEIGDPAKGSTQQQGKQTFQQNNTELKVEDPISNDGKETPTNILCLKSNKSHIAQRLALSYNYQSQQEQTSLHNLAHKQQQQSQSQHESSKTGSVNKIPEESYSLKIQRQLRQLSKDTEALLKNREQQPVNITFK